ncbi:hypothetical protein EJ110_NYTH38500 [Nymphaea thermarum]|nr:hypothetical protein EJ110_NYTH38500 [Nymphaea thermarum]
MEEPKEVDRIGDLGLARVLQTGEGHAPPPPSEQRVNEEGDTCFKMLGMEAADDERDIDEPVKTFSQVARNLHCHNGASKVDQVKETFKEAPQAMMKTWTSVVNGESQKEVCNIPSLEIKDMDGRKTFLISNAAYKAMTRPFDFAVVATLAEGSGRGRLDYPFVFETLKRQWTHLPSVKFTIVGKGNFLIRTQIEQELLEILRPGTWKVGSHFLTANRWFPRMKMRVAASSKVRIWIRLPNLPLFKRALVDISMVMDARLVGMNHCTKCKVGFVPTSEISLAFEDGRRNSSPATLETTQAHHRALAENHRSSHPASRECPEEENSHIEAQGDSGKNQTKPNIQGTISTPPASGINAQADLEMPQKAIFVFAAETKKSRKRRSGGTNKRIQNNVDGFVSKKRVEEEQKDEGSMAIDVQMLKAVNVTPHEAMPKLVVIDIDEDMAIDPRGGAPKWDGQTNSAGSQHGEGVGKETLPVGPIEPNHHETYHMKSLKTIKGILQDLENCSGRPLATLIDVNDPILEVTNPRITVREVMYGPYQALHTIVNRWSPDIATFTMVDNQVDTLVWANQHSRPINRKQIWEAIRLHYQGQLGRSTLDVKA